MRSLIFLLILTFITQAASADIAGQSVSESDYLSYIGNCPCPYNTDQNGNVCGTRSAWCQSGGYAPICELTRVSYDIMGECRLINKEIW